MVRVKTSNLIGPPLDLRSPMTPTTYYTPLSTQPQNRYVLYHHPCSDGMGAKYAAWKKFGVHATYIGVNYGQPVPKMKPDSEIYIIDFSYSKMELRKMYSENSRLVVLDHHKTAQEDLAGEPYVIFDMDRSGAVLAWNYFFPEEPTPKLLQIIQDRDLWKWQFPESRSVLGYLDLLEDRFDEWDMIVDVPDQVIQDSQVIEEAYRIQVKNVVNSSMVKIIKLSFPDVREQPFTVGITNCVHFISDVANSILYSTDYSIDFAICYFVDSHNLVKLSFRSRKDGGVDVSEIARRLAGGGHKTSAGAKINLFTLKDWLQDE